MATANKPPLHLLLGVPASIFIACIAIAFSAKFREHPDRLTIAITLDLLFTAPLAYYCVIRKTTISKLSVLRVFVAGVFAAGILLSKKDVPLLIIIKTWISPLVEITFIGFIIWKFYVANKNLKGINLQQNDFLTHCRSILASVLGSEKMAGVFASEVSVFYYAFSKRDSTIDYKSKFTGYKENGIILVLYTFLCLFLIEAIGMHFLFLLWNKTAAWIFTSLSLYTCLQLFAHIRALKARPHIITERYLLLRNGLMGGDAFVLLRNIHKIERSNNPIASPDVVKMAFIKGLEKHNLAIHLNDPVTVTKAFGIKKTATVLLVSIDKPKAFMEALKGYTTDNINY